MNTKPASAGCFPGGRFPLPSLVFVIRTAILVSGAFF